MLPPRNPDETLKARGAAHRPAGRFEPYQSVPEDDGWDDDWQQEDGDLAEDDEE